MLPPLIYRGVRFEEDIEENGKRWSKPYVPSMPLSSFIEFRQCFANGMVALDVPGNSLDDILGMLDNMPYHYHDESIFYIHL